MLLCRILLSHYFGLPGQDIKSDGFSIETCKIMVDMLDVSFNVLWRTETREFAVSSRRDANTLSPQKGQLDPTCAVVVGLLPVLAFVTREHEKLQMRENDMPHALVTSTGSARRPASDPGGWCGTFQQDTHLSLPEAARVGVLSECFCYFL